MKILHKYVLKYRTSSLALDVLCAAEAISLILLQESPGSDGCSPADRGEVERRRGSNRITPPLTQGSCLPEMLSTRLHHACQTVAMQLQYTKSTKKQHLSVIQSDDTCM